MRRALQKTWFGLWARLRKPATAPRGSSDDSVSFVGPTFAGERLVVGSLGAYIWLQAFLIGGGSLLMHLAAVAETPQWIAGTVFVSTAVLAIGLGDSRLLNYRQWIYRRGIEVDARGLRSAIPLVGPAAVLTSGLAAWPVLVLVSAAVLGSIFQSLGSSPQQRWSNLRKAVDAYSYVLTFFLGYPDRRFNVPAGVWIPKETLRFRKWELLRQAAPVGAAAGAGLVPWVTLIEQPSTNLLARAIGAVLLGNLALLLSWLGRWRSFATCVWTVDPDFKVHPFAFYTKRLRNSRHTIVSDTGEVVRESDQVFVGFRKDPWIIACRSAVEVPLPRGTFPGRTPCLVDRRVYSSHAYFRGATRSGKTQAILAVAFQLLRPRTPAMFLDLKFDEGSAAAVRDFCARQGIPFYGITNVKGCSSSCVDPFSEWEAQTASVLGFCQRVVAGCGLFHGWEYGRMHFSLQPLNLLMDTLEECKAGKRPMDFRTLRDLLWVKFRSNPRLYRDAEHVVFKCQVLSHYPQLRNPSVPGKDVLNFSRAFREGAVVYVGLEASDEGSVSVDFARLLAMLWLRTGARFKQQGEPISSYLFFDEIERAAGRNLGVFFEHAAGHAYSSILCSSQVGSDLQVENYDLLSCILGNVHLDQRFSVTDERERRALVEASGERIGKLTSETHGQHHSVTQSQIVRPIITQDDINTFVNGKVGGAVLSVLGDRGFTQFDGRPQLIDAVWPLRHDEYQRFERTPWPREVELQQRDDCTQQTVLVDRSSAEIERDVGAAYAELERLYEDALRGRGARPA